MTAFLYVSSIILDRITFKKVEKCLIIKTRKRILLLLIKEATRFPDLYKKIIPRERKIEGN